MKITFISFWETQHLEQPFWQNKTKKKKDLIPIFLLLICWIIHPPSPPSKKKRKEKTSKVTMIFHFFKVMPIMDRSAFCACPKQSEWISSYNNLFVLHTLCLLKVKNGTIVAMEYTLCLNVSVFAYFATFTSCNTASAHLHWVCFFHNACSTMVCGSHRNHWNTWNIKANTHPCYTYWTYQKNSATKII